MNFIHHLIHYYLIVLFIYHINAVFMAEATDYDAYGVKIAINQHFLVLAQNSRQPPSFFIQFAPYNGTSASSSQCTLTYPNITNTFIYTVVIGKKQNLSQTHFFFAGELTNDQPQPFIGLAIYNNTNTNSSSTTSSSSCDTSFSYSVQYLHTYGHQEYYILGVDPAGVLAYGFSNEFIFVFDSRNTTSNLKTWNGNTTWPDTTFIPHAVHISEKFGVVAGFVRNAENATAKYSPLIYLISFNSSNDHHPVVVDQYKPIPTPNTWQDLLTNADADMYSSKYDMSVSIDDQGKTLVGMQFINRVFFLSVNVTNPNSLTYVSRYTNGRSLGNGKSVAWLENGIAAVLINVYTLNYEWSLSQIFFFDIYSSGYNSTTTPLSVFPNSHQLLPSSFSSVFLNIVSSPTALALLDEKGKILIFSPTQAGFYPFVENTGLMPIFTSPSPCIPGTYKNRTGIYDCVLCSTGTKNPGNASTQCLACESGSFCPLGSVADISQSALAARLQIIPYPVSPESTIFDDILLHNMFTIGSDHCLVVSPLFWALIVAGIAFVIIVIIEITKLRAASPRSRRGRDMFIYVLKHMDFIGEGEYWVGGLASFSVLVLVSFAYAFSNAYLKQYPIEGSSPSNFACDESMRNAKFETNIQSLSIPFTEVEQEIFDLLSNQAFTLNIDFINTLVRCDAISIEALFGLTWSTIRWLYCNNVDYILTLTIPLPYQHLSVRIFLADAKTIGGLRLGLSGSAHEVEGYSLKELHFYQSFSKEGYLLSRTLPVAIAMTKVINETKPILGEESEFSGIYTPTFTVDSNSLFVSNDQYVRSTSALTTLTIALTETPYYVKNLQEPIARQPEIIFRNLLFTIVCLEIFGLVFLSYKLVFKPIYGYMVRKYLRSSKETNLNKKAMNSDLFHSINSIQTSKTDINYISSTF